MKFTEAQQAAIDEIDNNLQIIACAGSGKTEVITRRIANILNRKPNILPENIVAFTFTEKASQSMMHRTEKIIENENKSYNLNNMYIGTIHAFCYNILKNYAIGYENVKILDGAKNYLFVKRYEKECGIVDLGLSTYIRDIHLFLECREKLIDDYENRSNWEEKNIKAIDNYIECLRKHNYLDFPLLIFEVLRQIKSNPKVREYLSSIKYLIVDEYQDINDMQEKLIMYIAEAGANICVVGDDDQTIYQFRGSNSNNMLTFSERYEGVRQLRLEENFRSTREIIDIAKSVIKNNKKRLLKNMISKSDAAGIVKALRYENDDKQYAGIVKQILEEHKNGTQYGDIAILVRKGKYIKGIISELEKQGVPCAYDSVENYFEGQDFCRYVAVLRMMENGDKLQLYDSWKDVISDENFSRGFKFLRRRSIDGGDCKTARLRDIVLEFCDLVNYRDEKSLIGIIKILDDYDEIYGDYQLSVRINRVLDYISNEAVEEYKYANFSLSNKQDAVSIMTVHKSKGLEFNTVFIVKMETK